MPPLLMRTRSSYRPAINSFIVAGRASQKRGQATPTCWRAPMKCKEKENSRFRGIHIVVPPLYTVKTSFPRDAFDGACVPSQQTSCSSGEQCAGERTMTDFPNNFRTHQAQARARTTAERKDLR
jgi:hypothetical protein